MKAKLPGTPWFTVAFITVGLVVGVASAFWLSHLLPTPLRSTNKALTEHLNIQNIQFPNTQAVETSWLAEFGSATNYLTSPLGPLPCVNPFDDSTTVKPVYAAIEQAQSGRVDQAIQALQPLANAPNAHWLPVLTLSILQARSGNINAAQLLLDDFLSSKVNQNNIGELFHFRDRKVSLIIAGHKVRATEQHLLAFVHMTYNRGVLWLQQGRYGQELLVTLRHSVGLSKRLFSWGKNEGDIQESAVQTPGCQASTQGLTTTDVYNNLIVGYLLTDTFKDSDKNLQSETARTYIDASENNPLYGPLMRYRESSSGFTPPQHWIWALSNAEHIFHNIPHPENSLINYNLANLIDDIIIHGYQPQDALKIKHNQLLNAINWQQMPTAQRTTAITGIVGKLLSQGKISKIIPQNMLQYLDVQHLDIVTALEFATAARTLDAKRQNIVDSIVAGRDQSIHNALGNRADAWLRGMRSDIAQHLVKRCLAIQDAVERRSLADAISNFIHDDDAHIPDLDLCSNFENSTFLRILPHWLITQRGNWTASGIFGLFSAIIIWGCGWRIRSILRQRNILFANLYGIEAQSLQHERLG